MKNHFNALEVMEMAKDIEKKGKKFYLNHAKATDNLELKELFKKLAETQEEHYQKFLSLAKELKGKSDKANYLYDEEVSAYFDYLVELSIFPAYDSEKSKEALNDAKKALDLAIRAEKDAILFYRELCANNSGETIEAVEKLIKEKKRHLRELGKYIEEYVKK
ncbi:ferritin family protein [Halanaerobium sp. Z-7514]|uniref:Ferritin family protein n=1 Tax=Halanaerobium polyolivorans TaxID=2886943 RepID=A0AAW4WTG7_9FIRM|nr:ferritin family protein [Halanaerobium polyolivorans]MCC3144385.1 ferritin family protein [Halanaerobium polyolivorans]